MSLMYWDTLVGTNVLLIRPVAENIFATVTRVTLCGYVLLKR